MKKQRRITLEELQHELQTWMICCRDGDFKGSPEKLIRNLSDWAEMIAE